ncbi:uncharacterized protein LOC125200426 [Salvia hispanica]|uniref:uncharacterized protein LOC125200426 n=1 Tax=Salvia hispanica TaxID=49212 RepID=UPI002009A6A0|nr:uncharacterized protein LOC125200426 [Salvia hispanica]
MAFYFAHLNFKRGVFNHYPNLSRKRKRDSSGDHSCRRLAISSCNNFFAVGFGNGFVVLYSRVRGMSFVNVGLSCFSKWPVRGIILLDSSRLYVAYGNGDVFHWENPVGDMSTHIRICKGDMAIDGSLLDFSGTRTHWVGLYSGADLFVCGIGVTGDVLYSGGNLEVGRFGKIFFVLDVVVACTAVAACYFHIQTPGDVHVLIEGGVMIGCVGGGVSSVVLTNAHRVATIYRPSHDGEMGILVLPHTLPQSARCCLNESVCFAIDHGGAIVVFDVVGGARLYRLGDNAALRGSSLKLITGPLPLHCSVKRQDEFSTLMSLLDPATPK